MSRYRLTDHLDHMRHAAVLVCDYADGLTEDDFVADTKTHQAVLLNLLVLGRSRCEADPGTSVLR